MKTPRGRYSSLSSPPKRPGPDWVCLRAQFYPGDSAAEEADSPNSTAAAEADSAAAAPENGRLDSVLLLSKPKSCRLRKASITLKTIHNNGEGAASSAIELQTDVPVFYLMLDLPGWRGRFSDNCFHLFPDRPRKITLLGAEPPPEAALEKLEFTHLRSTY